MEASIQTYQGKDVPKTVADHREFPYVFDLLLNKAKASKSLLQRPYDISSRHTYYPKAKSCLKRSYKLESDPQTHQNQSQSSKNPLRTFLLKQTQTIQKSNCQEQDHQSMTVLYRQLSHTDETPLPHNPIKDDQKFSLPFTQNQQIITMQMQSTPIPQICEWNTQDSQHQHLRSKIRFLPLNQDFRFKQAITMNTQNGLFLNYGQLTFNNGMTVPLSMSHQLLFLSNLNHPISTSQRQVIFQLDQNSQTLTFCAKISYLQENAVEGWIQEVEKEVLELKSKIVTLLGVVGIQMDGENRLMRNIIFFKKQLKSTLEKVLSNQQSLQQHTKQSQTTQMIPEPPPNQKVINFGPNTDYSIVFDKNHMHDQSLGPKQKTKEGGYFTISYDNYIITDKKHSESKAIPLCRKTLKDKRRLKQQQRQSNQKKMKKQLEIIKSIKDKRYLIDYYYEGSIDNLEYVLMQKFEYSLQQYISYFGDCLQVRHKITIAKHIVQAVMTLHQSGIVHRDIKPCNFLIQDSSENLGFYRIKIIDFAESYSKNVNCQEGDFGCSHPYSPLECSNKALINLEGSKEGIANPEIDYWSVGMTLYQLFFRKLPVSFSRAFISDITTSWKTQLLLAVNQRQKYGLALVDEIVTIICVKMLKFQQQKRMKLDIAMKILQILGAYVDRLMDLVEQSK